MHYTTLIDANTLAGLLATPHVDLLVFDCRFDLKGTDLGQRDYRRAHIPGAVQVDLHVELCGPRYGNSDYPLPRPEAFAAWFRDAGANEQTQVVAYDDSGGLYAARLWWLLRWIGHPGVSVLDGGIQGWQSADLPMSRDLPGPRLSTLMDPRPTLCSVVDHERLQHMASTNGVTVLETQGAGCFRRADEIVGSAGVRFPHVHRRDVLENLGSDGRFKPSDVLAREFVQLLQGAPLSQVVVRCNSGVAACHHLLALEYAGLPGGALYVGSQSNLVASAIPPGSELREIHTQILPSRLA